MYEYEYSFRKDSSVEHVCAALLIAMADDIDIAGAICGWHEMGIWNDWAFCNGIAGVDGSTAFYGVVRKKNSKFKIQNSKIFVDERSGVFVNNITVYYLRITTFFFGRG